MSQAKTQTVCTKEAETRVLHISPQRALYFCVTKMEVKFQLALRRNSNCRYHRTLSFRKCALIFPVSLKTLPHSGLTEVSLCTSIQGWERNDSLHLLNLSRQELHTHCLLTAWHPGRAAGRVLGPHLTMASPFLRISHQAAPHAAPAPQARADKPQGSSCLPKPCAASHGHEMGSTASRRDVPPGK